MSEYIFNCALDCVKYIRESRFHIPDSEHNWGWKGARGRDIKIFADSNITLQVYSLPWMQFFNFESLIWCEKWMQFVSFSFSTFWLFLFPRSAFRCVCVCVCVASVWKQHSKLRSGDGRGRESESGQQKMEQKTANEIRRQEKNVKSKQRDSRNARICHVERIKMFQNLFMRNKVNRTDAISFIN